MFISFLYEQSYILWGGAVVQSTIMLLEGRTPPHTHSSAGYSDLKKTRNKGIVIRLLMMMVVMMGPRHANSFDTLSIFAWHSEGKKKKRGGGGEREGKRDY